MVCFKKNEVIMTSRLQSLYREYKGFVLFIVLMTVFRSAVADWNEVPSGSMLPTIQEGDRIYVNKLAYDVRVPFTHLSLVKLADPKRGDIVVFDSEAAKKRLVKRVIGLPGEVVELRHNELIINGRNADYLATGIDGLSSYFIERFDGMRHGVKLVNYRDNPMSTFGPVTVPLGYYLVLGDNRDNSADSRVYGYVPRNEIVGRSTMVVISLNYDNYFLPRHGRFFHELP
jgi:signal peptidase I